MSLRLALLLFLAVLPFTAHAAEPPGWPLWDGKETVEQYAKRAGLETTKSIELGGGVKLELVLIPAGKFIMGSPEREKPIVGQVMLGIGSSILLGLIAAVFIRALKKHTRPMLRLLWCGLPACNNILCRQDACTTIGCIHSP